MITNFDYQILSLIQFNVAIRDTLEYTLDKSNNENGFSVEMYLRKKDAIRKSLDNDTPLKGFLTSNGENGEKLRQQIEEIYEKIYSDDNTIVRVDGDKLEVDRNQIITILQTVLPVREQLNFIIRLHLAESAKHKALNKDLAALTDIDEKLYRGLVFLFIVPEMERQFAQYNKVRQEAKGAITPQSNFIQNDLKTLTDLLYQSRNGSKIISRDYIEVLDKVFDVLEETQGRRELREGHTFQGDFADLKKDIYAFIAKVEPIWKNQMDSVSKAFSDNLKEAKTNPEA